MTFDAVLDQVLELLQREKRVSYRALKPHFDVNDDYIEGIKDELVYAQKLAVDEENRVLVWTGEQASAAVSPRSLEPQHSPLLQSWTTNENPCPTPQNTLPNCSAILPIPLPLRSVADPKHCTHSSIAFSR